MNRRMILSLLGNVLLIIGGALLLHESLTGMQLLGGALILLSMIVDTLESSGAFRAKRG